MGLFDKAKEAMSQSGDAMKVAQQAEQQAGMSGTDLSGGLAARGEIESAGHENNRIPVSYTHLTLPTTPYV